MLRGECWWRTRCLAGLALILMLFSMLPVRAEESKNLTRLKELGLPMLVVTSEQNPSSFR